MPIGTQEEIEMTIIGHVTTQVDDARFVRMNNIHKDFFIHTFKGDRQSMTRALYQASMAYFLEHDRLLTPQALEVQVRQQGLGMGMGQAGSRMVSLLVKCQAMPINTNSFPAVVRELRERMMGRLLTEFGHTMQETIRKKGAIQAFDEAQNWVMQQRVEYDNEASPTELFNVTDGYQNLWNEYIERRDHPERHKGLEVGWKILDKATNGFKPGTLNLVIGEVGKGKSTVLLNMARGIHQKGKNVLFFSFEMPMAQVKARYVSSRLSLPYDGYVGGSLNKDEEAKLQRWFDDTNGNAKFRQFELETGAYFSIIDQPDDTSPAFVEQIVKQYRQMYGPPDAIFADYLNNMKCDVSNVAQWWEHTGKAAIGLRKIARIYDLASFSAQQVNREGLKWSRKKPGADDDAAHIEVQPEHIEGWKEVINTADSALGFWTQPDEHKMTLYRIKGRDWFCDAFDLVFRPEMAYVGDPEEGEMPFHTMPPDIPMAALYEGLKTHAGQREATDDDLDNLDMSKKDLF